MMEGRQSLGFRRDVMCRVDTMVMSVCMGDTTMPVRVCVAGKNGNPSQRGVERIVIQVVAVVIVWPMLMLGKADSVGVLMFPVTECDGHFEAVRLRDFVEGFPIFATIGEGKKLLIAVFSDGLNPNPIHGRAGEAEVRRNAILENR